MSETSTPGSPEKASIVMSRRSPGSGLARRELLVRWDAVRDDKRQIRPDRRTHRVQRSRMSQMRRVEAAAIDADLHFFAFFTSSIFGFCSLRL